jgi:hypothetical protein
LRGASFAATFVALVELPGANTHIDCRVRMPARHVVHLDASAR